MGPGVGKRAGGPSRAQGTLDEWDLRVSHWVGVTLGSRVPHWAVMLFEHGGNGLLWFPAALLLLALLPLTQRAWAANLLLGLILDIAVVGVIKSLVKRTPPPYGDLKGYVVVADVDRYSFPSGHASRAVMVALVASTRPELSGAGPRLALGAWAAAACLARVLHRRHYVGDVLAGVAVGVAVAGVVTGGAFGATGLVIRADHLRHWLG